MSKIAFVREATVGVSVYRGNDDTILFSPGEVIPVHDDNVVPNYSEKILTKTADGVFRYVSKGDLTIFDFDPTANFMLIEDAMDVVKTGMKLFMSNKNIGNIPANSMPIFKCAMNVVEDHFMNSVFNDDDI